MKNIALSDYLINGQKWDLKEITGSGKDSVRDAIKNKKSQAERFVIDITRSKHNITQLEQQIENLFSAHNTLFVKEVIVIKGNKIVRILKRK